MWEKLIQALIDKGLISAEKKAELQTVLDSVEIEKPAVGGGVGPIMVDTSKFPPELKQTIDTLVATVNALKGQNKTLLDTLGAEKAARDAAIKAAQDQAKAEQEKKVNTLIADAFGDGKEKKGKLPEAKKEWFKSFAEKDPAAAEDFLKDYPGDPHLKTGAPGTPASGGGGGIEKKPNPMSGVGGGNSALLKAVAEQSSVGEPIVDLFPKNN